MSALISPLREYRRMQKTFLDRVEEPSDCDIERTGEVRLRRGRGGRRKVSVPSGGKDRWSRQRAQRGSGGRKKGGSRGNTSARNLGDVERPEMRKAIPPRRRIWAPPGMTRSFNGARDAAQHPARPLNSRVKWITRSNSRESPRCLGTRVERKLGRRIFKILRICEFPFGSRRRHVSDRRIVMHDSIRLEFASESRIRPKFKPDDC